MWTAIGIVLVGGAGIAALCSLSARAAREKERVKQLQQEAKAREKMEQILDSVASLSADELLELLRSGANKK